MTSGNGIHACILGTGAALPDRVLSNADLEKMVDTSDEWISTRTGIKQRRIAASHEYLSIYASRAGAMALSRAGMDPGDVDLILCATVTPDMITPATACFIQRDLGCGKAAAFDLSAGCSGFLYALSTAQAYIEAAMARTVLIIGGEILSRYINWQDRTTCVIFADGAGAVVLKGSTGDAGILASRMHTDGTFSHLITIPGGGSRYPLTTDSLRERMNTIRMKGNETFKIAVRSMASVCREVMTAAGTSPADIDLFIPHQANRRIIEAVGQRLGIESSKCHVNIDRMGNTSSASIPIALHEVVEAGRLQPGSRLLLTAFGAGLTWAASLIRWGFPE